ncbi:MAG: GNAT family N-acetyltransferase [Gammaproteobacteria bacterium]|nr:GNAT family N-acetyltransferase [Gammaproteobacteria bacterium]
MNTGVNVRRADWEQDRDLLRSIREQVFIEEQKVPKDLEWDDADADAIHFLAEDHRGTAVGTARLLPSGQIGRMAVVAERRGFGVGRALLDAAIEAARDEGRYSVFLHAQTHAQPFYAKAGFHAVGEQFEEAGIPHVQMEMTLGIHFAAQPDAPRTVIKAEETRIPYEHPALGDHPNDTRMLEGKGALAAAILELCERARREILILAQDLDPALFDSVELNEALSRFARRNEQTKVRILVHDITRMVRDGHRLLTLSRRLPSSISIRLVHPDMQDRSENMVLADRTGLVVQPQFDTERGFANLNDAPLTRQYGDVFDRLYDRSLTDPNLRQMTL